MNFKAGALAVLFISVIPGLSHAMLVSSGTGFFVSNNGYIVTNEHVVRGCSKVMIRGAVDKTQAEVVALDSDNDLALLQTQSVPQRIAAVSSTGARLNVGEPVLVMGYPLNHGISGDYAVVQSKILSLNGPKGEDKWIEFESSAQQGNSGGPLLDTGGNVVGVIVGKAYISRLNSSTLRMDQVAQTDIAISLPVLEAFLQRNRVFYRKQSMGFNYTSYRLENIARDYIVNIHCPR